MNWFTEIILPFFIASAFLLPICLVGTIITAQIVSEKRIEVLLPAGLIGGIGLYIFLLNSFAFIVKGTAGIIFSYGLFILLGLWIYKKRKVKIDFFQKRTFVLWMLSGIIWAVFLFILIGHENFGGDTFLYYSIAKSFSRGNFPLVPPWQPDIPLSYHYGASIFLGAFSAFTHLAFDYLHRFLAFALILALSQLLIWMWKRHTNIFSLSLYQLLPLVCLISVGTFMIVLPVFPLKIPHITSFYELYSLIKNYPSIDSAIENWGAPSSLGLMVYFIHQTVGLPVFFWIILLALKPSKENIFFWTVIVGVGLLALSLINEVLFFPLIPVILFLIILKQQKSAHRKKHALYITGGLIIFCIILLLQGGMVTRNFAQKNNGISSIVIFPNKTNTFNYKEVHFYNELQQSSRFLEIRKEWLPFQWIHIGVTWRYLLATIAIIVFLLMKKKKEAYILGLFLFIATLELLGFDLVIPQYRYHNGNRFLYFAYQLMAFEMILFFVWILEDFIKNHKYVFGFIMIFLGAIIILPSLLPALAEFGTFKQPNNYFLKQESIPPAPITLWIEKNIPEEKRIFDLARDRVYLHYGPYPLRINQPIAEFAGALTPIWDGQFRSFTSEASPQYLDMIYTLNPTSLSHFKISYVVIDSDIYDLLPEIRKNDLTNKHFFTVVFQTNSGNNYWERLYQVNPDYLKKANNLNGTLAELEKIAPKKGKYYIDKPTVLNPLTNLRKALIFTLRDRDIHYINGTGMYENVETSVNGDENDAYSLDTTHKNTAKFDYLVLYGSTDPNNVCQCKVQCLWDGLNGQFVLWKIVKK